MPQGAVSNGKHIDAFIPPDLRDMFYRHPTRPYAWNNGLDPYGFTTNGLVLYLPLWALRDSAFNSVDAFKHTCTVTGALWQPDGRLFDGTDDQVLCGNAASLDNIFDGGGTLIFWVNVDSDGEGDSGFISVKTGIWSLSTTGEAGGKVKISFSRVFSLTSGVWVTTATEVTIGISTMVAVTYDNGDVGNNPTFYINDSIKTVGSGLTETSTPEGTRTEDASADIILGGFGNGSFSYDGKINEALFNNQTLSAGEISRIYNSTAWR